MMPLLHLLLRTLRSYGAHACGIYAGAMAFFGVLSLFPLVLLLITLLTILVRQSDATALVLSRVTAFLPGSETVMIGAVKDITDAQPVLIGAGTLGLLWSSMGVFLTLGYALNRVWEVPRDRHLLLEHAIAAGLTLSVGLLVLLSLLLSTLLLVLRLLVPGIGASLLVGSQALDMAIVAVAAAVLYRTLPNAPVRRRDVLAPACLMAMAWEGAKLGFTWYLSAVAQVDRIYGPIAAIAGLMLWLFVSATLLLLGAEMSHQFAILREPAPDEEIIMTAPPAGPTI